MSAGGELLSLSKFASDRKGPLSFVASRTISVTRAIIGTIVISELGTTLPLLSSDRRRLVRTVFFSKLSRHRIKTELNVARDIIGGHGTEVLEGLEGVGGDEVFLSTTE